MNDFIVKTRNVDKQINFFRFFFFCLTQETKPSPTHTASFNAHSNV